MYPHPSTELGRNHPDRKGAASSPQTSQSREKSGTPAPDAAAQRLDLARQHGMNRTVANIPSPERISSRIAKQRDLRGRHGGGGAPSTGRKGRQAREADGPFRALKMQRALAQIGYGARNALKKRIEDIDSFARFPLLPAVHGAIVPRGLGGLEDVRPTPIQRVAIPALMGADRRAERKLGRSGARQFLLAAETGSGKTLAYLIPCIDAMKRAELEEREGDAPKSRGREEVDLSELAEMEYASSVGKPRVIVLVPTAELVDQVGQVAKSLFSPGQISSGHDLVCVLPGGDPQPAPQSGRQRYSHLHAAAPLKHHTLRAEHGPPR